MKIRLKFVLVVVPIVLVAVGMVGAASYFNATTGITRIAHEFLDFKAHELEKYALGQWQLLVENDLTDRPEMVEATKFGVESFARGMLRSDTEAVFAFDDENRLVVATDGTAPLEAEREALSELIASRETRLTSPVIGGIQRVAKGFYFPPYGWYLLQTEHFDVFYGDVQRITRQSTLILASAVVLAVFFVTVFSGTLTRPLRTVVASMRRIIASNDLDERVPVEFGDETGELAHTFNLMTGELSRAHSQIKTYALQAVVARKKESKIRTIFQKYVPQELIDRFYANPESMLVGENRELAVLFSDIRSFTSISEQMSPDELVDSLNRYFSVMVDVIMERGGVIDKYIGDAIMAFFGAPVQHEDDAYRSVMAGLEMRRGVRAFNERQRAVGKPEFRIGIGINFGEVTVGNIGTERKMDYTVIGDMVNLASRLEGLTKIYDETLLISHSLRQKLDDRLATRLLDTVAVKGKQHGVRIYAVSDTLSKQETSAWAVHNRAMERYYRRDFAGAAKLLQRVLTFFPQDKAAARIYERARRLAAAPPPADWNGVAVMETK